AVPEPVLLDDEHPTGARLRQCVRGRAAEGAGADNDVAVGGLHGGPVSRCPCGGARPARCGPQAPGWRSAGSVAAVRGGPPVLRGASTTRLRGASTARPLQLLTAVREC